MDALVVWTIGLAAAWALTLLVAARIIRALRRRLRELDSAKRSQSTRYGQITEQFAPFLAAWPWDPKRFRFLGDPIDGIQFADDGILFIEIKAADGRLSAVQRQVRDHVQAGRVAWREVKIR